MKLPFPLPWGDPPGCARGARPAQVRKALLRVESLEPRLALSASALDPADEAYQLWRQQTYALDDVILGDASPSGEWQPSSSDVSALAPVNNSFGAGIHLNAALADYPYRGGGYSVAVLDTGIDYTHRDLGGGFGQRVIAGYDFVNKDNDPMDDNGHGTHVAGIIGASSQTYSGVAPNVNLIALKVLDKNGSGSFGNVADALQWVSAHQAQYNIVAVNLSLGSGNYTSNPYTFLESDFAKLKSQGVFISVAAGNSFYGVQSTPGVAYPATSPNVVSVGAVWTGNFGTVNWASGARDNTTAVDRVASFSQRSASLSIMAPGAIINSTYVHGGYQTMAGTSMAAPVVAGAAALLHQAMDARGLPANQDTILSIMRSSGANVIDGDDENDNVVNTGLTFKRLDVLAALQRIHQTDAKLALAPVGEQVLREGSSRTIALAGSGGGGSLLYTARTRGDSDQAYQLKEQLGLTSAGSYFQNTWGANEKWIMDRNGGWIALLPNGELRRWAGSMDATLQPAALIATLSTAIYNNPELLLNAQPGGAVAATVAVVGNQLTLHAPAGYQGTFTVEVTLSDGKQSVQQSFKVTVVANAAPQLAAIAAQQTKGTEPLTLQLSATDANQDPVSFTAVASVAGAATLTVAGSKLTIAPRAGYVGTFTVTVTASDGLATAARSFQVTVAAPPVTGPSLAPIPNLTLRTASSRVVVLSGTAPSAKPRTYAASVRPVASMAYQLKQKHGLTFAGSYYANAWGAKEKWMLDRNRGWVAILPNGELRRWAGSMAATLQATALLGQLSPAYYNNPALLLHAKPPTGVVVPKVSVSGNRLTIWAPQGCRGTFTVDVKFSVGGTAVYRSFVVTVVA